MTCNDIEVALGADGTVTVTDSTGNTYPGYFAMWFSIVTHSQDDIQVWLGDIRPEEEVLIDEDTTQ